MASANEQQQQQRQQADLIVLFDCDVHLSKQDRRDKAKAALQEYQSVLDTLHNAGLAAAGKPGNTKTEIMVLISCPLRKLYELVEREKYVCTPETTLARIVSRIPPTHLRLASHAPNPRAQSCVLTRGPQAL